MSVGINTLKYIHEVKYMKEDKNPEKEKEDELAAALKTPPPTEYTTSRNRVFHFGKPSLRHRRTVVKVLKIMQEPAADYKAIVACAKERGMELEEFLKLDESDYTEDELRRMIKKSSADFNIMFADMMTEVLTEVLYATIKKAPFQFTTIESFEEGMDDYAEAVELFPVAVKWVAQAAVDIKNIDRKNL